MTLDRRARPSSPLATSLSGRPTTLSARAAHRLARGPLDAVELMREVCQVARLQPDAAERMAIALLSSHAEFEQLPSGHWSLRGWEAGIGADRARGGGNAVGSTDAPATSVPSLADIAFAVVDVETTGTRAGTGDRITEIAIAQVRDGAVQAVYSQLVNPERTIPAHITALTRISSEMVRDQPTFAQVTPDVTSRLAGHVFTAHNASFDWRFVSEELSRSVSRLLTGPRLCTVRLARVFVPGLARYSLDSITHYFGVQIGARHRAEGDAVATAHVLLRLLSIAGDRGIETWPALDAALRRPGARRGRTGSDRRRRAFPLPVTSDDVA